SQMRVNVSSFLPLLLLVSPCGGRAGARDAVLVHRLDVAHVAEANRRTGYEDVPVQSRRGGEQWVDLLGVRHATPSWVVPRGGGGVDRVESQIVVHQRVGSAVEARLGTARRSPAVVVVVVQDVVHEDVVVAPNERAHA